MSAPKVCRACGHVIEKPDGRHVCEACEPEPKIKSGKCYACGKHYEHVAVIQFVPYKGLTLCRGCLETSKVL